MSKIPSLIIENFEDQTNALFLTLLEYKKAKYITVIENVVGDEIQAYVLDQLVAEDIDQDWFMSVATLWFYGSSERYPLSFEFAKIGQNQVVKRVLKTFNVNSTSRVIGKLFSYDVSSKPKVKRRKVSFVQEAHEIKLRSI